MDLIFHTHPTFMNILYRYEKKPTQKATTEFTSSLHACVQPILALFDLKINSELDKFIKIKDS